jgi:zinc protease
VLPTSPRRRPTVTLAALLLALASVASAKPNTAVEIPDLALDTYSLPNGLEVILYEDHSTPIVGVNLWYHVGSGNERPGRTGFAHLFEHMMFQGSAHQDHEYINEVQGMGGFVNGSTTEDRTNYIDFVPASHLEQTLLLEADRMGWLLDAMTEEKFKNQQDVVRNERRQSEGQPYAVFWLHYNEAFYPKGHPYDHSVIGAHEDLANATLDDVKDFFRTYYTPNNATLCISGDFDPAATKRWIEKYFAAIPPGPPVVKTAAWVPELSHEKRLTMQDHVQLPRYYFAWHTPPAFQDGDADLDLATRIVGQGRTSRLYKRLVHEEKLAQDVAFFVDELQVSSAAILYVTLRPGADGAKVERLVNEELARFASRGPTAQELEQAKNDFQANFLRSIESVGGFRGINDRLNRYNHYVGTPDYLKQDWERYASRTPATLRDAFARWIGPGRMVVEILPVEEGRPLVADVDRTKLPAPGPSPSFRAPEVERTTLSNGVQVVFLPHRELPLVQADLVFRAGAACEAADRSGLCDLAASMHLEGTKRRDKFAFQSALAALGTNLWCRTNEDRTLFSMQCLESRLDESMELLAEAILEPAFPAEEFGDLQERRLVDIRRRADQPYAISAMAVRRVLFGESHPYGRPVDGTAESVGAIGLDDVRRFSAEHFQPANAVLVVVGDTSLDEIRQVFERRFRGWTGGAPTPAAIPEPAPPRGRTVYLIDKPGDSQSTIAIVQLGLPRSDPDWEKAYVANRMYGGAFSSRLNLNLREDKGYTYGARGTLAENVARGAFSSSARVQTEVTAPALVEFMKELTDAGGKRPFTEEELGFAKESILLGYPRDFETVGQLAGALDDQIVWGLPDDAFARYPEKIAAVDVAAANAAAKRLFRPDDVAIVVVGDLAKIEEPVRALGLGPVVHLDREGRTLDGSGDSVSTISR